MKINISKLSEGIHTYQLSRSTDELGLEANFIGSVFAAVQLEKSSRQIFLRADLRSKALFRCDRCAEEFLAELTPSYRSLYVWNESDSGNKLPEEFHVLRPDTNIIDISDDVRQFILLSVPLKLLCKESCAGLCSHCGRNLNDLNGGHDCAKADPDPRWNNLAHILQQALAKN